MPIKSAQSLHHFIAKSPWSVTEVKEKRLTKILKELKGKVITIVIDETGDRKRGAFVSRLPIDIKIFSLSSDGRNICATWAFNKLERDGISVVPMPEATKGEKL